MTLLTTEQHLFAGAAQDRGHTALAPQDARWIYRALRGASRTEAVRRPRQGYDQEDSRQQGDGRDEKLPLGRRCRWRQK